MSLEQFADRLFQDATGWLGWTPQLALTTPVPQILLALRGKVDFVRKTNPFGGGGDDEDAAPAANDDHVPKTADGQLDRDAVAAKVRRQLEGFMTDRRAG